MEFIDTSQYEGSFFDEKYRKKVKSAYQNNDLVIISNQNNLRYGIVRGEDIYVFKGANITLDDCIKRSTYGFLFTQTYYKHDIFDFPISVNYRKCKNNKKLTLLRDYLIKKVDYILKPTFTNYNVGDILLARNGEAYVYIGKKTNLTFYEVSENNNKGEFILEVKINSKKHLYLELAIWLRQLVKFKFENNLLDVSTVSGLNSKKNFYHTFGNINNISELKFKIGEYNNKEFVDFIIKESSTKRKECSKLKKYKNIIMEVNQ